MAASALINQFKVLYRIDSKTQMKNLYIISIYAQVNLLHLGNVNSFTTILRAFALSRAVVPGTLSRCLKSCIRISLLPHCLPYCVPKGGLTCRLARKRCRHQCTREKKSLHTDFQNFSSLLHHANQLNMKVCNKLPMILVRNAPPYPDTHSRDLLLV